MYDERISEMFREEVSPNAILQRVFGELHMAGAVQIKIQDYISAPYYNIKLLQLQH